MTTTNAVVVVRIDVGKSNLDAYILDSGIERRFDNSNTGHRNLHQSLFGAGIQASWPTRCAQAALPMPPANSPRSTSSEPPCSPAAASSTALNAPRAELDPETTASPATVFHWMYAAIATCDRR